MDALIGLCGAVIGAVVGYWLSNRQGRRHWMRQEALTTRLLLADLRPALWAPTPWAEMESRLQQVRVRFQVLGIDDTRTERVVTATRSCWQQSRDRYEAGDPEPGISSALLDDFDEAMIDVNRTLARL